MASLDNFHTGNGVQMRTQQYPSTVDRMRVIGMGLVSNRAWDLGNQVPVSLDQYRAKDTVSVNQVTPRYTERQDTQIRDLLVPTVPYAQRMRGSTSESVLMYDKAMGAMRNVWGNWVNPGVSLNQNSRRIRYKPY